MPARGDGSTSAARPATSSSTHTRKLVALFVTASAALFAVALLAAPSDSAPPSYGPAPTRTDMTLSLVVGVTLLVVWLGCGIYFLERARRRRGASGDSAQLARNE